MRSPPCPGDVLLDIDLMGCVQFHLVLWVADYTMSTWRVGLLHDSPNFRGQLHGTTIMNKIRGTDNSYRLLRHVDTCSDR